MAEGRKITVVTFDEQRREMNARLDDRLRCLHVGIDAFHRIMRRGFIIVVLSGAVPLGELVILVLLPTKLR